MPVESVNWLIDVAILSLVVELANDSCTVPLLPEKITVVAPFRPLLEPRKFNCPVCAEVTTETLTDSVAPLTFAELMLIAVNADAVLRPDVE